jgi:hypothetical protein
VFRFSNSFIIAALLFNCVGSAQIRRPRMIPVNRESRSIVLRAPVIVLVRVESVETSEPAPVPGRPLLERKLELKIRVLEIIKGELDDQPGSTLPLNVSQFEPGIGRQSALPGVWTGQSPALGTDYLAFSKIPSRSAAIVAGDEGCERILAAADALPDLRVAVAAENSGRPAAGVLEVAIAAAPQIGHLLAEYLSVKTMDRELPDPQTFTLLMDLIEKPALHETPRITLLQDAYAKVVDSDRPPTLIVNRFVVGLVRVLAIPEAAEWRTRIKEDYLPAVIRLDDKEHLRTAAAVFSSYPSDRHLAERVLSSSARLSNWLKTQ